MPFNQVKHCLPYMKRGASIINTSSVTAYKVSFSLAPGSFLAVMLTTIFRFWIAGIRWLC
jgi:NAD(P)-dependent dehydrogenase (short-subunit alcohol dehydrogenase family)